ncbi:MULTISPECIES: ribosome biogenesis factor YjgA [Legionella]|uniref:Dual-action ribosomal maturation protein DarP n=1 Tax=Legionella septentrionalis TaxID=2498109 RepID=A0A433JM02_9GAMM|nr:MULTISPECIES: ribosome biogenesis factor YjgA [Legionella]MCP0914798.1 DUF615 domain-containing protein [Legionella sp. 27cVA30]RUQ91068.1 DUF615 domain-containing protein [Legionella septentrionalis]RUR02863.1 DUF615 domain-containing protein [Legionella septentrionalis]RUR11461.1 DUF615 domain-containing protein [Legionella septentrionalis]RUR16726.1 DUF615 domain-containing protein [Legionella septentrionalis]
MDEPKSKSQKKREADALQKVGVKLIEFNLDKLDKLPLTPQLKQAIIAAKSIRSHGASRRQAQLIGKLMRAADHEAILAAYEKLQDEENAQTASFHQAEEWRARLIAGGNQALAEFIDIYHPDDVQQLRQLIKKAVSDQENEKNTGASRALFRYLRLYLQ